jgi:hypothetical protein
MRQRLLLSVFAILGLASCAGQPAAPPAAPGEAGPPPSATPVPSGSANAPAATPAASAAAPVTPGAIDWKSMSKEDRGKYMKEVVMPKMKEVFTSFDPKYSDMKCTLCHGSAALNGSFTMPNPELPQLPHDMSKFKEWASKKPQMTEFMVKHVKPEMAKLLNLPEYNPETKIGFGCGECHTVAAK